MTERAHFGPRSPEHEQNKAQWKKVFELIKDAPSYFHDKELQNLIRDDNFLTMIASMVELPGDGTVDWLPTAALKFAELYREEFKNEKPEMQRIRANGTLSITGFIGSIKQGFKDLKEAKEQIELRYETKLTDSDGDVVSSITGSKKLPGLSDIEAIFAALKPSGSRDVQREMRDAQIGLTNLAREIIRGKGISSNSIAKLFTNDFDIKAKLLGVFSTKVELELTNIVNTHLIDPSNNLGPDKTITKNKPTPPGLFVKVQKEILDRIIQFAKLRLVAPGESVTDRDTEDTKRRETLSDARAKALAMAKNLKDYERELLRGTEYAKSREEYFTWLRGHRVDVAVYQSFDTATGQFTAATLLKKLEAINPTFKDPTDELTKQFKAGLDTPHRANLREIVDALKRHASKRGGLPNYDALDENKALEAAKEFLTGGKASVTSVTSADITPEIAKLMTSVWNQEPLMKFLEEKGFKINHIAASATHILYRSYIGPDNADLLIRNDLGSLKTGMLIDLSADMFDGDTLRDGLTIKAAQTLMGYFSEEVDGSPNLRSVNQARFVDAMRFVFLGEADATTTAQTLWDSLAGANKGKKDVHIAQTDILFKLLLAKNAPVAEDTLPKVLAIFSTAVAGSDRLTLKDAEFVTHFAKLIGGDPVAAKLEAEKILAELKKTDINEKPRRIHVEKELFALMKGRAFAIKSGGILKHLHSTKAPSKGFIGATRDLTIEAIGTVSTATSKWWEWLSSMPEYYMNADLSEKLLALDDRRQANLKYASMIEALLTSSSAGGGAMEENIKRMRALQEAQDKAAQPLDIADGAIANVNQAYILLQASKAVMDRLEKIGLKRQPEDVYNIAFWIAMESGGGIEAAKVFINDYISTPYDRVAKYVASLGLPREGYLDGMNAEDRATLEGTELTSDTEEQFIKAYVRNRSILAKRTMFISQFIADHPRNIELEQYLTQIDINEESTGQHILDVIDNKHGIRVRPMAMQALMGLYRTSKTETVDGKEVTTQSNTVVSSMRVGRWLIDRDGTVEQQNYVRQALEIVLEGPVTSKKAIIDAFITRTPQDYWTLSTERKRGRKVTVSVAEADDIVRRVQAHLTRISSERQKANEQLRQEELYGNPLENGLRAGIETLQDLWAGDMVNKTMVIGALVAGIYIIRKILTEGGKEGSSLFMKLAKWSIIGLPLLIVANAAIKSRTGRDYMGEMLKFMPKEERAGALERFRRRSKEEQRYTFLGTNAGHEALRQLSGPNSSVSVKDLLVWREQVQASTSGKDVGHNVYSNGAPPGLKVSSIMHMMGQGATKEDAYKMSYLAFEALLTDVATLRGYRGSVDERAEKGADIVRSQYVDFVAYDDRPDMQARMKARQMSMLDVIISESQTPATMDAIANDRNFVEWFADAMGWTYEEAKSRLSQLGTRIKLHWQRTGELLPELWDNAWEKIDAGATNVYDFYRKVKPRLKNELGESVDALWRTFLNIAGAAGILIKKAPRAGEVVVEFVGDAAEWSIDTVIRIYDQARAHSVIGNLLNGIEAGAQKLFGANFASLLALRGSYRNDPEYVSLIAEFPRMAEGLRENLSSVGKFDPELNQKTIEGWLKHTAKTDFDIDVGTNFKTFANLNRYQRMAIFEKMKRRAYSLIIAERVAALKTAHDSGRLKQFKYPVTITHSNWKGLVGAGGEDFPLADEIEKSFGLNTLALIATEKDWAGAYLEWIKQNTNTIRPPLEFLHFAVDWATMDSQTEHIIGSIEQFTKMFLVIAKDEFGGDTEKLKLYKFYLETIATNVVLEAAMGARNGQVSYDGPKRLKKADLQLLQSQATSMIAYFKTLRGFSPDASQLDGMDLKAFKSSAMQDGGKLHDLLTNDDLFLSIIQDTTPENARKWPSFNLPIPKLSDDEKEMLEDNPEALKNYTLDALVEILHKARSDKERDPIRKAFDAYATDKSAEWEKLDSDKELEVAFKLMMGVTDGKLQEMRTEFFTTFQGWAKAGKLGKLQKFSDFQKESNMKRSAIARRRIQDTIDRTIQGYFDKIDVNAPTNSIDMDAMKTKIYETLNIPRAAGNKLTKYSVDDLKALSAADRLTQFGPMLADLAELYKVSVSSPADKDHSSTVMSDAILRIMEHLLYVGDNESKDTDGNGGFAKFEFYMLKQHSIKLSDDKEVKNSGGVDASAKRMASDEPEHTDSKAGLTGHLDLMTVQGKQQIGPLTIITEPGHIFVVNERLKGVQ